MVATDRVGEIFADARAIYQAAIERLEAGDLRDAAEKAWCATKRATDALLLARTGEEPQSAGQARRGLLRLSNQDEVFAQLHGNYQIRSAVLHVACFYDNPCEPEASVIELIRTTADYIREATRLAA